MQVLWADTFAEKPGPNETRWAVPVFDMLQQQLADPSDIIALNFGLWYDPKNPVSGGSGGSGGRGKGPNPPACRVCLICCRADPFDLLAPARRIAASYEAADGYNSVTVYTGAVLQQHNLPRESLPSGQGHVPQHILRGDGQAALGRPTRRSGRAAHCQRSRRHGAVQAY